jgi:hypothetical protein
MSDEARVWDGADAFEEKLADAYEASDHYDRGYRAALLDFETEYRSSRGYPPAQPDERIADDVLALIETLRAGDDESAELRQAGLDSRGRP